MYSSRLCGYLCEYDNIPVMDVQVWHNHFHVSTQYTPHVTPRVSWDIPIPSLNSCLYPTTMLYPDLCHVPVCPRETRGGGCGVCVSCCCLLLVPSLSHTLSCAIVAEVCSCPRLWWTTMEGLGLTLACWALPSTSLALQGACKTTTTTPPPPSRM